MAVGLGFHNRYHIIYEIAHNAHPSLGQVAHRMYPISYPECHLHQAANAPGVPLALEPKCNCCHLPTQKQSMSICFTEQDLLYLGPGTVLFFRFLVIGVVTVLIPALSYSLACFIMNYQANAAQLQSNPSNWILLLSNISGTS